MEVNGLIVTLASIVMPLQVLTHAQPTLAHQADNLEGHGIESLIKQPKCDVFFKNESGQWEQGISKNVPNEAGCIKIGKETHEQNIVQVKEDPTYIPPPLVVKYTDASGKVNIIFINPSEPKEVPNDYHLDLLN